MNIILYSTGCPKCNVLKKKLNSKNIEFTEETSIEKMLELNIMQAPVLCVDGTLLGFEQANQWVNAQNRGK